MVSTPATLALATLTAAAGVGHTLATYDRVKDLIKYINFNWGKPEHDINPSDISAISGKKGVMSIEVSGWTDASGHVTLWNGSSTGDGSRYQELSNYDHYNGAVKPERVML